MKAVSKSLRITPKKLNLIAALVRNRDVVEAMDILNFAPKKGAKILYKVVASAVANAKTNFKQDEKNLFIKEIVVTKAPTMKRWLPASRGRAQPILKRNSHVSVIISVKEEKEKEVKKTAARKTETKPAAKSTKKPTKTVKA